MPERENNLDNLDRELVISAPNAQESPILRRGLQVLTGILILLILAFCFFASSICITVLLSGFLAILADPAVRVLEKLWIPRFIAAGSIVLTAVLICGFLIYESYDKLTDFSDEFPSYISRIGDAVSPISRKIERVQDSAGKLQHEASPKKVPEVRVQQNGSWAAYLVRRVGSVWGVAIIAGVVPFLMFFMLLARDKIFFCLKTMFGHRVDVDQFADRLTGMVRSYVAGNLVIGVILSAISILVFWRVGLTPAVTLGMISGALNLIPFLGIMLAMVIPLIAGVFQFHSAGPFIVIGVTVVALHLIAANLLIPHFVGSRLDVGPVAATIGLLFWGWLWGVPGLLLAVPLTGFVKLMADANPSLAHLSNLLAREPQRLLFRRKRRVKPQPAISPDPL
jgi:predicted PurR-regulated permease PerM